MLTGVCEVEPKMAVEVLQGAENLKCLCEWGNGQVLVHALGAVLALIACP